MSKYLNHNYYHVNDEFYTPKKLVDIIKPYISKDKVIWCPFDTENSEFVKELSKTNKVIYSHIDNNQSFFEYEPTENYDIIVSNPPFSKKIEVFKRLYALNKPFAIIMPMSILNYNIINNFFIDKDMQLLIVDKKISFIKGRKGNMFNSSYFCRKLLPKDIIFTHIEKD